MTPDREEPGLAVALISSYGHYRWFPKILAYRADFCLNCDAARLALRIRTVDFFSVLKIPILPLGIWRRWYCAHCGNPPHHKVSIWRAVRFFIAISFVVNAAIFWAAPIDEWPISIAGIWAWRAATLALAGLVLWWALRPRGRPTLRQKQASVRPLEVTDCAFCGQRLDQLGHQAFCRSCGRRHLPLSGQPDHGW